CTLITKAGEREWRAATRGGAERRELRLGAVVEGPVQIRGVGPQSTDLRVIGVDNLTGLCIGVAGRLGLDRLLERAIETPEHDTGVANGLQRVPGHYHLRRCIRAELQMQSGDRRCRYRIGRAACGGCGLSRSGSDQRRRHRGPSADACGGEQLATTEFEVEFGVLCGHGGEVAPRLPREPYQCRKQYGMSRSCAGLRRYWLVEHHHLGDEGFHVAYVRQT